MIQIDQLKKFKDSGEKISMVTCYDSWTAKILAQTGVDVLLVGDSVSMVVHGFNNTLHADLNMMTLHTQAVNRVQNKKPILTDLPFLCHRKGKKYLLEAVDQLMKAGASALKIETQSGQEDIVRYLVDSGIPIVGHLGLTPQYFLKLGGFKVQGSEKDSADHIFEQALQLEQAGISALVLECVPKKLAAKITQTLSVPTIGIGAGNQVDGQVLVLQDLLGFKSEFNPRFVRSFAQGDLVLKEAIAEFCSSVKNLSFPSEKESFQ